MKKSALFEGAIIDAKAIRATAIANAKASLEEAFMPKFNSMFADKLREESDIEENIPPSVDNSVPVAETVAPENAKPSKNDGTKSLSAKNTDTAAKPTAKNITPSTIPAGKDGGDGTKCLSDKNEGNVDGTPKGVKENTEISEENFSDSELDEIIKELESEIGGDENPVGDDVGPGNDSPETEPSPEVPPTPEAGTPITAGTPVILTPAPEASSTTPPETTPSEEPTAPETGDSTPPAMEEEEINLEELLSSLNEESKEKEDEDDSKEKEEKEEKEEVDETFKAKLNEITAQRDEAYKTVEYLRSQINEVMLLNSKLLYTNKLFKGFLLNRDQKVKIVESFDLTKNTREVKMTYANWVDSLNFGGISKNKNISLTNLTEGVSKPVASTNPKPIKPSSISNNTQIIAESDVNRFQKLAGIKKKIITEQKNK